MTSLLRRLAIPGKTFVQLSGGEPTVRDDLPEIVRTAKRLGCKYIQLNSNGIRLAEDENFVRALASAGLSFVFMQFDGTNDFVYKRLRGRPLLDVKKRAMDNCAKHGLGVVLVPTIVKGVNTDGIGETIRFAASRSPSVRGVHFQPVCFLGRTPIGAGPEMRFTLDELICEIKSQTPDLPANTVFSPSSCDHPLCGFHSDFVVLEEGRLYSLSRAARKAESCCDGADYAGKNREFIGSRWSGHHPVFCGGHGAAGEIEDMEYFAQRAKTHSFTVTAMAFQDAWNMDLERLRSCSLHVFKSGQMVPFCANYLTPAKIS
jgi:uncharacterized radical SAM superfamily Fe-S cluster-containing enzyme